MESLHGHTDAAKIKDIALKSERVPETPEARLNRLVLDHFLNRLLEENACLAARLKAQSAEPHPQQENNVVPLAAKRADDRAWRDYVYGGRGAIVAWSPPGDRWEAT